MITLDITIIGKVDKDDISTKCYVVDTRGKRYIYKRVSHMSILNMICEKSNVNDFWDVKK